MKRLLRRDRAVTPVVAAVIMILVTTIGMSVLFAFFVNYTRDYQLGSGSSVLESFVIEDVWIQDPDTVEIWVYNVGQVDFTITGVYINDIPVEENLQVTVVVGAHEGFTVTPLSDLIVGDTYLFKIVTARGSSVEGRFS
jgi:flagellin-like protein